MKDSLQRIKAVRHLARTDLFFLATEILGYTKIRRDVHQPVIDTLIQFGDVQGEDIVSEYGFNYNPLDPDPVNVLPTNNNRRLILDPRGWYKTTINCIAHSVQIILNFPDVTIQVVHSNLDIVQSEVLSRVKAHFMHSDKMRFYFPEFCAPKSPRSGKYADLGTMSYFSVPNRANIGGTPTFSVSSIGSTGAGQHFHWLKFGDIVTEQNCFGDQLEKVAGLFNMYQNLLIGPKYFIDVEGTCYHYGDVYNKGIIKSQLNLPEEKRSWKIFCRGCYIKDPPEGEVERFGPEERSWPYKLDNDGNTISRFESEFPWYHLEQKKHDNEWIFACQQLNNPLAADEANRAFPLTRMRWMTPEEIKHVNFRYFTLCVDTAEKITKRSDYTAMCVAGWDRNNRAYIVEAVQGKYLPKDTINNIFELYHRWNCMSLSIEEAAFNRGLDAGIRTIMDRDPTRWMHIKWIKRDTHESKAERILSLQPFFNVGTIRFSTGIRDYEKDQIKEQFSEFPAGTNDDLIDCIADQFQGKTDFGTIAPRPDTPEIMARARERMFERAEELTLQSTIYADPSPYSDKLGAL